MIHDVLLPRVRTYIHATLRLLARDVTVLYDNVNVSNHVFECCTGQVRGSGVTRDCKFHNSKMTSILGRTPSRHSIGCLIKARLVNQMDPFLHTINHQSHSKDQRLMQS